jgi:S1-C subfamily serine protease
LLSGIEFKDLAEFSTTPLQQGDDIFLMGNPDDDSYILRKGYYAGIRHNPFGMGSIDEALFDFNGFFGDSGSGLFNTKGELVGINSAISTKVEDGEQMKMMGAFALRFTAEQLDKARTF